MIGMKTLRRAGGPETVAIDIGRNLLGPVSCPSGRGMPATEETGTEIMNNRWLTRREFEEALTRIDLNSKGGIEAGGPVLWSDGSTALVDTGEHHTLVVGSTGSGKSRSMIIPAIDAIGRSGESMIVFDCKGELSATMAGTLQHRGYVVIHLDFREPWKSNGWNPLQVAYRLFKSDDREDRDRAQSMIYSIADLISPCVNTNEPYWEMSAQDLLIGAMHTLFTLSDDEAEINLLSVMSILDSVFYEDDGVREYFRGLDRDDIAATCLKVAMENADSTKRCIMSMTRRQTRPYIAHESLACMMSVNDVDFDDIGKGGTAVFLTVPDETESMNAIATLFVSQCYEMLVRAASARPDQRLEHRVNFILDEFSNFPQIPSFGTKISTCRGRNIRFILAVQSLRQLDSRYGKVADTIRDNCLNFVFLASRDKESLDYASWMAGDGPDGKRLISPVQLMRLDRRKGQALVIRGYMYPYISRLADLSCYNMRRYGVLRGPGCDRKPKVFDMAAKVGEISERRWGEIETDKGFERFRLGKGSIRFEDDDDDE